MSAYLQIADLAVHVGRFALGPLTLELQRGDYFVLMGPSGCGKTTLLKTLAGFHRPGAGAIVIGGEAVTALAPQRRGVGYVPQTSSLFPHLTVAQNVAFGLRFAPLPAAERRRRIDRMVALTGIEALLERRPTTLSGGEGRRVALARSLAVNPRVLLLDEPLSMLDTNARAELLATLRRIHDETQTVTIHVTHHAEEAWARQGSCGVMRAGRIVQTGTVADLFRQPRARFVAEFLGGRNVFPARFEQRGAESVASLGWCDVSLAVPVSFGAGFVQFRPESWLLVPEDEAPKTGGGDRGWEAQTRMPDGAGPVRGVVREVLDRGVYREVVVSVSGGPLIAVYEVQRAGAPAAGATVLLRYPEPPHAMAAE